MAKKTIVFLTLILFIMATALCCCTPVLASHSTPSCCHKNASSNKADQCTLSSRPGNDTHACQCQKITQGIPAQDFKATNAIQNTKYTSAFTPALTIIKIPANNALLFSTLQNSPPENLTASLYLKNSVLRI